MHGRANATGRVASLKTEFPRLGLKPTMNRKVRLAFEDRPLAEPLDFYLVCTPRGSELGLAIVMAAISVCTRFELFVFFIDCIKDVNVERFLLIVPPTYKPRAATTILGNELKYHH